MKTRLMIMCCLVVGIVMFAGYERSRAAVEVESGCLKIATVSVRTIFRESKRSALYRQAAAAERQKIEMKLTQLGKEIDVENSGMKMLIQGSNDYMVKYESIVRKQAELKTEKDLYTKKMSLREQKTTEDLYKDILAAVNAVAQEKGFGLVLEKSEPEFPSTSPTQLELSMGSHKILYSGCAVDITAEVMAHVDAATGEK